MTGIETRTIDVGNLSFTADVCGPADGPLVLCLHGFPQTRYTWRYELPALAAAGFQAVAPDQRGYSPGARSGFKKEDYVIENMIGDALAIADAFGAERFHLVGHDWGGQIAWCTAALHSDRVMTLSIASRPHPAAFRLAMSKDPNQPERSKHHRSFLRAEVTEELAANNCAGMRALLRGANVPEPDTEAYLSVLCDHASIDAALNWYRATGKTGLSMADLPAVTMPTLFVWGDADQTVGRLAAEATAQYVDGPYRFVELPGIGHFITDEAPMSFAPLLLDNVQRKAP